MREISLNILDLAQNSIKVEASLIKIYVKISKKENIIEFSIDDNGCGMSKEKVSMVTDPFFTSRTERKVGLGIPFFKLACEQAGGSFSITSKEGVGTTVCGSFQYDHIDRQPMGDLSSTMLFIITASEKSDIVFTYVTDEAEDFCLDTREIKEVLQGVPLDTPEVMEFLKENLAVCNDERK